MRPRSPPRGRPASSSSSRPATATGASPASTRTSSPSAASTSSRTGRCARRTTRAASCRTSTPAAGCPTLSGLVGMRPEAMYIMLPVPEGCVDRRRQRRWHTPHDGDETTANDGWAAFSGTSAATPQIAGVCALIKQACAQPHADGDPRHPHEHRRDVTTGTNHPNFGQHGGRRDRTPRPATGSSTPTRRCWWPRCGASGSGRSYRSADRAGRADSADRGRSSRAAVPGRAEAAAPAAASRSRPGCRSGRLQPFAAASAVRADAADPAVRALRPGRPRSRPRAR